MSAEQALRDGDLQLALDELQKQVRADPSSAKHRVFLFQLLAVMGQWDRALTQLNVAAEMDPLALPMKQTYQEAIGCEVLRAEVFAGKRSPMIFGEPEQWLALLIQAAQLAADGKHAEAQKLRDTAYEAAPTTSGKVLVAADVDGAADGDSDQPPAGRAFEWIADADSRLGPLLEVIVNGRYYWAPFHRIARIDIEPPADLRDFVWMPAHFVWTTGGETVGLVPTRYVDSQSHADDLVRLSRKTEWTEVAENTFFGHGQRLLTTDIDDFSLMDIRSLQFDAPAAASESASEAAGNSEEI